MSVTYKPDHGGTNRLMNSAGVQRMLKSAAAKGMEYAIGIAPVDTGEYKESFRVTAAAHSGVRKDRAQAFLVNTSPHAGHVEWQDGAHVLARAADFIERAGP